MFEVSPYIINYTEISSLWCAYSSYVRILLLTNDREFEGNDEAGKVLSPILVNAYSRFIARRIFPSRELLSIRSKPFVASHRRRNGIVSRKLPLPLKGRKGGRKRPVYNKMLMEIRSNLIERSHSRSEV